MSIEKKYLPLVCIALFAFPAFAQDPPMATPTSPGQPTASDQAKGSTSDVELTRRIREELTKDNSLSINAKNVKIITIKGTTTLRGPVNSAKEKQRIGEIAKTVTGHEPHNNIQVLKK